MSHKQTRLRLRLQTSLSVDWIPGTGFYVSITYTTNDYMRPLMAKWLRGQGLRDMKCTVHDLKVMGSNPGQVELGVRSSFVSAIIDITSLTCSSPYLYMTTHP